MIIKQSYDGNTWVLRDQVTATGDFKTVWKAGVDCGLSRGGSLIAVDRNETVTKAVEFKYDYDSGQYYAEEVDPKSVHL